jgi:hypothetical protein
MLKSALLLAVLSAGCLPPGVVNALHSQASFDLNCPEDKLTFRELGQETSQAVEGCGKRARYVMTPNGDWVMNTLDGQPAGSPTSATVPAAPPETEMASPPVAPPPIEPASAAPTSP